MKSKALHALTCGLLVLSAANLLRADRMADLRNEIIPVDHTMSPPLHLAITPFTLSGPTGLTPLQLRHAYGFDQLGATGTGQIIAIVDAYGSTTIQADLNTFCTALNVPSTTVQVYYPQGQPAADSGWALETSLDVEWAHAIAPGATIALIASKSNSTTDLFAAVDYAVNVVGAKQVSMSWGGPEYSTEASSDFHFNVSGVTFLASSGDSGAGAESPACSPYVVGVGGTTLHLNSSNNISSETAWSGSGGGPSLYESLPSYQIGFFSGTARGVPDVAYDADPNTGVPVFLTGDGWVQVGGTSMSAPQWAALFALANSLRSSSINSAPGILYSLASANYAGYYHDITSGSNGQFSAGPGYDLVTGLGTPTANQLVVALAGGFASQAVAPVFSPGPGIYVSAQNVTIVSATPGASIRYTTNGSTPSETNGTLYSGPVNVSNTTLMAIAYKSGFADSAVTSGVYTIGQQAAAPAFSPVAGAYSSAQTVTISTTTSGASIRYTTDGSTPTETAGTLYTGPVSISGITTLNAIAYETGFIDSPVTDGVYTISSSSVLYNFTPSNNGGTNPFAGLVLGSDGNFYGTTELGGSINDGTVFKITPGGVLTNLASFNGTNGDEPLAGLVQGSDGNFYGTTYQGGSSGDGTVFKITPTGVLTTLVSFTGINGAFPAAALVKGSDGNFYSTTESGGSGGDGTVLKMTPTGVLTTLASFNSANGAFPYASLVQGSDGSFYGTTYEGGSSNDGTVFKVTPAGVLTTLVSFTGTNGAFPYASLVQGNDGNFYGTTFEGGSGSDGTIFKITPAGVLTTLIPFTGANGAFPVAALVQGGDGNFYGTTYEGGSGGNGTLFKMTPAGVLTTLVSFNGANGIFPTATLVQGSNGNLFGTAESGGSSGAGVVFEMGTQQTAAPVFNPAAGLYTGTQTVTITTTTGGASIRYTTDNSLPTETSGTLYTGPLSIGATTTVNAIAFENGLIDSTISTATFTIQNSSASGGGGAFDDWFLSFLALAGLLRWRLRKS